MKNTLIDKKQVIFKYKQIDGLKVLNDSEIDLEIENRKAAK